MYTSMRLKICQDALVFHREAVSVEATIAPSTVSPFESGRIAPHQVFLRTRYQ